MKNRMGTVDKIVIQAPLVTGYSLLPLMVVQAQSKQPITLGSMSNTDRYAVLKTVPLTMMKPDEKVFFLNTLTSLLSRDSDFRDYNKAVDQVSKGSAEMYAKRSGGTTRTESVAGMTREQRINFYRSRGVKEPEKHLEAYQQMLTSMQRFVKKFPEFKSLDTDTRKQVVKDAYGKMKSQVR